MRVVIVGPAAARARLASRLPDGIDIIAEARSVADARRLDVTADAWLIAPPSLDKSTGELEATDVEPLTLREMEVLELLAQGLSNKSIATRLGISDQTVKFHVASICGKLGASNRTEVVRKALRLGLIPV